MSVICQIWLHCPQPNVLHDEIHGLHSARQLASARRRWRRRRRPRSRGWAGFVGAHRRGWGRGRARQLAPIARLNGGRGVEDRAVVRVVDHLHRVGADPVRSKPGEDLERSWLQTTPVHCAVARNGKLDGVHRHSVKVLVFVTTKLPRASRDVVDVRALLDNVFQVVLRHARGGGSES